MKILYILNIANRVNNFSYTSMMAAKNLGWDFHIAGNWNYGSSEERLEDEKKYGIKIYQIDLLRQPYHPKNILAYKQLLEIAKQENFDIIHCNTPIGGVIGRLVGLKCGVKRIIYQVHGFHFYKGAPILNWILYYPIEKWLARYTDSLITINQEDYELAKRKFTLRNKGKIHHVPGVGINLEEYKNVKVDREALRLTIGVKPNDIMLISMGDLIKRKNYKIAIEAVAKVNKPNLKYVICGSGLEMQRLQQLSSSLGVSSQIVFLGFRSDIKELLNVSDIFLLTTLQEGLPRSLMEAMASGLPCVVSKIRGNVDLIEDGIGGFLCAVDAFSSFAKSIETIVSYPKLVLSMRQENLRKIKEFEVDVIIRKMKEIYIQS